MTKYEEMEDKKIYSILTVYQWAIAVTYESKYNNNKGEGWSVPDKTDLTNRCIDLDSDDSLASSGHSAFSWAVDGTTYICTDGEPVNKKIEPYNTYLCSIIPQIIFTLEDMHLRLGGALSVTITIQSIAT